MKIQEIVTKIQEGGFNCAFARFTTKQQAPFCIVRAETSQNIYSDEALLRRAEDYTIEIYYRNPQFRLDFEDYLSTCFIWQRTTADISLSDDKTLFTAVYDLIGSNYEHFYR